jgi:peptidoglycan-associated lipoprotein
MVGETQLFYASFDTDELIVIDEESEEAYAKIFEAQKGEKGWEKPSALDTKINREGFHNSNVYVTADGERMFFTRALLDGNVLKESKIMLSVKGNGGWQGAEEVEGVNTDSISKHPAIGELFGREVLFFVSNRDGGEGGFDLYYAPSNGDGTFGLPVNLKELNTPRDESSPFFRDGTLYFSTDGYPTMGGQDVFYSLWDGTNWSDPVNMGKGINSSVDDLYFSLNSDGYKGVLVSNRPDKGTRSVGSRTCCNDIFEFEIPKITAALVVGLFTEEKKPLLGGSVSIEEVELEDPFSQTNTEGNAFNFPLAVEKSYKLVGSAPGYFPDSVEVSTLGITETTSYEHRFYLTKMPPPPPPEPEFDTIYSEQPIELSNIYYDFDDDVILKEAEQDLEFILELMNKYPEMTIELRSHTDARGNADYNQQLSQSRTESARRWLVREGVSRGRIEAKGYGETEPKTVNENSAAANDFLEVGDVLTESFIDSLETVEQQEAAHRLNRRTEFQILEGPKSIQIKRTRLRKNQESGGPKAIQPKLPVRKISQNVITPHRLSSLYGKKDLTGFPMMHFTERVVDFGMVKKGEKREHVYEFTNLGDTTLEIDFVDHCDCTEVDYPRLPIAPGESGKISIVFDSADKDEAETISVDIFLKQVDPANDLNIFETVQYVFDIEK